MPESHETANRNERPWELRRIEGAATPPPPQQPNPMHAWARSPVTIGLALLFLPPVGIFLAWKATNLSRNAKVGVTVAGVAWTALALAPSKPSRSTAPATEPARLGTPPAAAPSTPAPASAALPAAREPSPEKKAKAAAARAEALIGRDPRILIPDVLAGLPLDHLDAKGDLFVRYRTGIPSALPLNVTIRRTPEALAAPDGTRSKAIKLGAHDATLVDDAAGRHAAVLWRSGPYLLSVVLDVETASAYPKAKKAVLDIAAKLVEGTDGTIDGTALPNEEERAAHLATIDAALASAAKRRADDAVAAFAKRIQDNGLNSGLLRVGLDGAANDLVITVTDTWLAVPKAVRREHAVKLWRTWAGINTPTDLDASRITIKTSTGREVGGSGGMGSLVSVD